MKSVLLSFFAITSLVWAQGESASQAVDVQNPSQAVQKETITSTDAPATEVRTQAPLFDRQAGKNRFGIGVLMSPVQDLKFEIDGFLEGGFNAEGSALGVEGVFFTPIQGVLGAKLSIAYLHAEMDMEGRNDDVKTDKFIFKGSGLLFATEQLFFELGLNISTTSIDFPEADRAQADSGYLGFGVQAGVNYVLMKNALLSVNYTRTESTKDNVRAINLADGRSGDVEYKVRQSGFLGSISYLF